MSTALLILGILIVLLVMLDILITTLTVGGGGPLTSRVSAGLWQIALQIHQQRSSHRLLLFTGWGILVTT